MKKIFLIVILCFSLQIIAKEYNVLDYGAKANGVTLDTKAVQTAIDLCSKEGGGTVLIPLGKTVLIGIIYMKDFVTLYVENGAVLLGSPNYEYYASNKIKEYTLKTLGNWWSEFGKVGTLPASGIYARHIKGLFINNVQINTVNPDERLPIIFDDVIDDNVTNVFINRKPLSKNQIKRN